MKEVEWSDEKCKGCKLPLRRAGDEVRCANTNCPGDPAPTPDAPHLQWPTLEGRLQHPLRTAKEAREQLIASGRLFRKANS